MSVTLYLSTDASAPALTGQVGSLTALLDAILVNGYGSKAAAGWTIAYTATNKRDYKQGTGSNGYYLDVDDSGPGGGGAREARMRGYEAMTALATGTQPFPTTSQSSFATICRKSTTADSTARPWYLIADATCFYLFVDTGDLTNPAYSLTFAFGDFFSYKSGDTYNSIIIGRSSENTNANSADSLAAVFGGNQSFMSNTLSGHYVDRMWTGVGGSIACGKFSSILCTNVNYSPVGSANSMCSYPNGPDGALELAPIWICHNGSVRGYLKGLWAPCHYQPCGHGDTFTGTGNMAGKSFLALNVTGSYYGGNSTGQIVVETSNTWS